jgi:TM2 domain-containing membrane protein YozV
MYRIIGTDGQQYGPVNAEQLRRWLAENRVNAQTLAQPDGAQEWKALGAFAEFAADFTPPPPPASPPPLRTPPLMAAPPAPLNAAASNKIPAGIFGILLGGFGIHKFILGYTGAGLIMLLVTVLSCFLAYPLMHLIGLIEGIIYLTKSDPEFVSLYVERRREWF